MGLAFFQLLQEVCSLGRDPKCIGFKMGAKTDGSDTDSVTGLVQGPGRVISGAEEPMSDEEEDDDDRFSFTTTASAAKILAESDKTKDSSKYVLLIIIVVVIVTCTLIYLHTWQRQLYIF